MCKFLKAVQCITVASYILSVHRGAEIPRFQSSWMIISIWHLRCFLSIPSIFLQQMSSKMQESFKQRLLKGDALFGIYISFSVPSLVEMFSQCGFDWLWLDFEHAGTSLETMQTMLASMNGSGCASLVRLPWNDIVWIKRVLDLGPDGIIIPMVCNLNKPRCLRQKALLWFLHYQLLILCSAHDLNAQWGKGLAMQ